MTIVERIVSYLLDDEPLVRACSWCEQEFGRRTPGNNVSHGMCRRHLAAQYQQMQMPDKAAQILARPETDFPPDMASQGTGTPPKATFWATSGSLG